MICIADYRLPKETIRTLEKMCEVLLFSARGLVYDAVSGHPDLFLCKTDSGLIYAPNCPSEIILQLQTKKIELVAGLKKTGNHYPETSAYNCVTSENYLIHRQILTDSVIKNAFHDKIAIDVKQGYARCTTMALPGNRFLTSDAGILKKLTARNLEALFVNAEGIVLPGLNHGFIGGVCGLINDTLVITGSLKHHPQNSEIEQFIALSNCKLFELSDAPLFDAGGLLFIE
jgi:hypothetical protein